jgi:nitrite reductase/ring-hydroxylating ferredoxin subunit/uncharacterized membrane protein
MLKDLLQGKPFGLPIHPALVHFPMGLFILSFLFDLGTILLDSSNVLVRGAFYTMALGTVTAVIAAVPGLADWADIRTDHPDKNIATTHMVLNLAAVVLYGLNLFLRYQALEATTTALLPLILYLIGVGLMSVSGDWGGTREENDGVASGRHYRHTDTPEETIRLSSDNAADDFVVVAPTDSLGDRETLRVEVDGRVMTIANLDGQYVAFQEFCTHRFGPLSEGHFHNGQIVCPWHRSCFDVHTGKVTQGPAKVDLKMYEVAVRDGYISVRVPQAELEPA